MKKQGTPEKNRDTNELEIKMIVSKSDIEFIKESVLLRIQKNLGDMDDKKNIKKAEHLKQVLYEIHRELKD